MDKNLRAEKFHSLRESRLKRTFYKESRKGFNVFPPKVHLKRTLSTDNTSQLIPKLLKEIEKEERDCYLSNSEPPSKRESRIKLAGFKYIFEDGYNYTTVPKKKEKKTKKNKCPFKKAETQNEGLDNDYDFATFQQND